MKIDFGQDAQFTQVMDVNFDGLVDVVVSTGTEYQTFYSLGRYPDGDGQFGHAQWTGASSADISLEPVTTCVPHSGLPVQFGDAETKLADMNGDGITDIVRVRRGDIQYWPGRGNGFWGTGARDDCEAGTFGSNRHREMTDAPHYSDIEGSTLRLNDVNGDGLSDLEPILKTLGHLEQDHRRSELEKCEVVVSFRFPANDKRAESVVPGVGSFDDPTTRPRSALAGLLFLAS